MMVEFQEQYPDIEFKLGRLFWLSSKTTNHFKGTSARSTMGEVKMNCDTCQYRLDAMEHIDIITIMITIMTIMIMIMTRSPRS